VALNMGGLSPMEALATPCGVPLMAVRLGFL